MNQDFQIAVFHRVVFINLGTLLRRHRIPKSENGQHFIVSDLNVGKSVEFYSRCFTITGCDEFTKTFLELNGINVPNPSSIPLDPYTLVRNELASRMKPRKAYLPKSSLKKFLENDRRVLRFYCVWDDTNSMFGDVRDMVLHYFLSDDTIEIKEAIPANSGRQGNTLFLRRCKLPKKSQLEAMGGGDDKDEYYNETDLVLGSILHLHGRPFVICNCDDFTREYYLENYGLEHLDPVQFEGNDVGKEHEYDEEISFFAKMQDTNSPSSLVPNILAHNTTREAVLKDPKPVKYDFKRMIKFDGVSLRFSSVLVSSKQIDKDRKFIVVLYPADDTIGVFEPKQRNSGIIGGKFMEKKKVLKPDQVHWYSSSDFFVGGRLVLHGHEFELTGCDEFSTGFMKREPLLFRS